MATGGAPCLQRKTDCASNMKGICIALADTRFNKPCPFYITETKKKEYERLAEQQGYGREKTHSKKRANASIDV